MTDTKELNAAIARVGLTKKAVAAALELSPTGFWKKLSNVSEFKAAEIKKLQSLLKLSDNERDRIFFASVSD